MRHATDEGPATCGYDLGRASCEFCDDPQDDSPVEVKMTEPECLNMNKIASRQAHDAAILRMNLAIDNLRVAAMILRNDACEAPEPRPAIVDGTTRKDRWAGLRKLARIMKRGTP